MTNTILVCIVIATFYFSIQVMYALWKINHEESINDAEFKSQISDTITDIKTMQAVKTATDNRVTKYEEVRRGDKIYIQRKEYYRCIYCGSKTETTNHNCTQCGAPLTT